MKIFKRVLLILIIVVAIVLILVFTKKPSNHRDWESGFGILPETEISQDEKQVTIKNIRDWNYSKTDITSTDYTTRTYNLENIDKVWFLVEPFSVWQGVAHTYFIFDFTDQEPIAFSIEARREKGEKYDAFLGAFNKYEIFYTWGTERDITGRRAYKDNDNIFMYPLKIEKSFAEKLFVQFAKTTEDLVNNPQFYNTLTSNCTNNLAKEANKVVAGTIPFHYALFLPGYSGEFLYKLGYINTNLSYEEIKKKSYITTIVNEIYTHENFSKELRERLQ